MARWKITPTMKKSIREVQEWVRPDQPGYINHEIGWRSGEFYIETEDDTPPVIGEGVDILNCDYTCDDWSTDDGCWEDTEVDVDDEVLQEEVETFLEDNSIYDLEEQGWVMSDCYMYIECDVNIERVD